MSASSNRKSTKKQIKVPKRYGPEFSVDDTWAQLSRNIREIQHNNAQNLSFEENHRYGYNMVLNRQGNVLYNGLKDLVREHLKELADTDIFPTFPVSEEKQTHEGEVLLKALRKVWDDHTSSMTKIGQILKYMDRVFVKPNDLLETWDLGLDLFIKNIIQRDRIQGVLITVILNQVRYEREGYPVNQAAIQSCVDVLLRLRVDGDTIYKRELEPALLEQTTTFYQEEGKTLVQSCDVPDFLTKVERRFQEEDQRAHHYLASHTAPAIKQILKTHLLAPHLSEVISMPGSGLDVMIDTGKISELERLYSLYALVPTGLVVLKKALKESLASRGKVINEYTIGSDGLEQGESDPKGKGKVKTLGNSLIPATEWVQRVLELKDLFDHIWQNAFKSDRDVEVAINEAFGSFINLNDRCSEFLSLFIDDHLRRGLKGKSEVEMTAVLDKTITVFRYVTEKDVFERYYKGHLSKRLLQTRSVSDDAEREMISRLKVECGYQFTQKLEGMFNDIRLSAEAMEVYQTYLTKTTPPQVSINVTVMTSTYWPMSHSASSCNVPTLLAKSCQSFEQFYLSRHSGRRLTWQYSLGSADIRAQFRMRSHDLNVSTFALVILLLFENIRDNDFLSYSEIKEATAILDSELKRHLQSLACAKFKILKKHPPGRDINDDDTFSFNDDFTCSMQRIKKPSGDLSPTIINNIRDLLLVAIEMPELEEGEPDVLGEFVRGTNFDSQLYLFETAGILASLTSKTPERQASLLLSLVKPLLDDLSTNLQLFREKGLNMEDLDSLVPIVKVHHIIMALGNIAKGFPDYPSVIPENYSIPSLEVFSEIGRVILVCLEAMNVFKVIRDSTRFAFARILATAGPTVASFIPPLMGNLLAHFEPSELVDFLNFIGLLIFRLNKELFNVIDQLIGPLNVHLRSLLSQPISGTDDERAHIETKKAYLALLNNIMAGDLQGIFTSERNSASIESLLESMLGIADDTSQPSSQKAAFLFLNRCVTCWGRLVIENDQEGLPGFDRFIYERIVPLAFRVPSSPDFNLKDGQVIVALHEICHLLQTIISTRGEEAIHFFLSVFFPAQNWPPETALECISTMQSTDPKVFRKYFTDLIRSSRRVS